MKNNKWLALIILITPLVVLSLSTLTFYFGYKPDSSSNNGELIYPHIETDGVRLKEISGEPFSFKKGKWYLIYFDNLESFSESEETYKLLFSLNTTLGREMNRVKRVVVLEKKITSTKQKELIEKFPSTFFLVDTDREDDDDEEMLYHSAVQTLAIEIEQLRRFKKIIYINPKQLTEQPGVENNS